MNYSVEFHICVTQVAPGHPGFDPLAKVRPFVDMLRRRFIDVYQPQQDLSFDEGGCPWKGRLSWRVYNPRKPHKFHIKLYELCEAGSGWVVGFDIYTGGRGEGIAQYAEEVLDDAENATQTTKVVIGMLAYCGLLEKGHRIYMDNYYSSPELYDALELLGTYACGTLRSNRKEVPKAL